MHNLFLDSTAQMGQNFTFITDLQDCNSSELSTQSTVQLSSSVVPTMTFGTLCCINSARGTVETARLPMFSVVLKCKKHPHVCLRRLVPKWISKWTQQAASPALNPMMARLLPVTTAAAAVDGGGTGHPIGGLGWARRSTTLVHSARSSSPFPAPLSWDFAYRNFAPAPAAVRACGYGEKAPHT